MPSRPKWFACACCPPNIARLIPSLPHYCCDEDADSITIHQYIGGTVQLEQADICLKTEYPYGGQILFKVTAHKCFKLYLRIPGWCENYRIELNGKQSFPDITSGYAEIEICKSENCIILNLDIKPRKIYSHPSVKQSENCVAFGYGPLIYCIEGVDNPEPLCNLKACDGEIFMGEYDKNILGGIRVMNIPAIDKNNKPLTIKAIPYYSWANREQKDMRVWIKEKQHKKTHR